MIWWKCLHGGKERIKRLNEHFNLLTTKNIKVAIILFGFVHIIKEALKRMDLYDAYFENAVIIGNDSEELSDAFGSKGQTIKNVFGKNLSASQILFVDDDEGNIEDAKEMNVCKTLTILPRKGMSNEHMEQIEDMAIHGIEKVVKQNTNDANDKMHLSLPTVQKKNINVCPKYDENWGYLLGVFAIAVRLIK